MSAETFWRWLDRRAPWLATPGVLKAIVLLNALTFLLIKAYPAYAGVLALVPEKIMRGEIWRLATYIFVPETQSVVWILFALLFLWFLSNALEELWGPLRLNVFYLIGMAGCTVAAFFFGGGPSNTFLNLSLFFAFATLAPDYEVFLFFLLRVKIKYIAWFMGAVFALQFLVLPVSAKMAMAASLANYLLFFGPRFIQSRITDHRNALRLENFRASEACSMHCCARCGRTEASNAELEFRVTQSGEEYCMDHLPPR